MDAEAVSRAASAQREHTTELLAADERAAERRRSLQLVVLGSGLALVAAGLPSERLWLSPEPPHNLPGPVVEYLSGFGSERVGFLASAIAYGLALPVLARLLVTIGFARALVLPAALCVLVSPACLLPATLNRTHPFVLLVTALVVRRLFLVEQDAAAGRVGLKRTSPFAWVLVGAFLPPEGWLLIPVACLALGRRLMRLELIASVLLGLLTLGFLVTTWSLPRAAGADPGALWSALLPTLGLGVGLVGLLSLATSARQPEESPPPRWLHLFWLSPLVSLLASPAAGPLGAGLAVVAAIGLADRCGRVERLERGVSFLWVTTAAHALLSVGVLLLWHADDPLVEWRAGARQHLEPGDLVITDSDAHAYLLRARWGVEARVASEASPDSAAVLGARDGGRRVVLDLQGPDPWPPGWPAQPGFLRLTGVGVIPAAP